MSTDPAKVEAVNKMVATDLMELDGVTPSQTRVRSFLGLVNYYHTLKNLKLGQLTISRQQTAIEF